MNKENKKCPQCKSKNIYVYHSIFDEYDIICKDCNFHNGRCLTEEDAWKEWNKRNDDRE